MQEQTSTAQDLLYLWLDVLTGDFQRYWVGTLLVTFLIWGLLRPWIASRKIQPKFPRWRQIRREVLYSMQSIVIFSLNGSLVALGIEKGIFKVYSDIGEYGIWYFIASTILALIIHDTYFYWVHRAMHHPKLFKHMHRTHHRSRNPTPFTAYAFDAPEAVVMAAFLPIMVLFLPLHHVSIGLVLAIMILRNAIGHCGFEVFPRKTLRSPWLSWNTTVTHHDMHHRYNRSNYGFYFSWWDKLMGTEDPEYEEHFERATAGASQPLPVTQKGGAAAK